MILNGEAYVPPSCPAVEMAKSGDIENMEFLYLAHEAIDGKTGKPIVESCAQFFKRDDPDVNGYTTFSSWNEWQVDEPHARRALVVAEDPEYISYQEQLKSAMKERVKVCHGPINGECWALGKTAVQEILRDIVGENFSGPEA